MEKTYWPEIRALENELQTGNPDKLIEFILMLAEHNLLDKQLYSVICDTWNPDTMTDNSSAKWKLLHDFACDRAQKTI